jgi:hypothetical protein
VVAGTAGSSTWFSASAFEPRIAKNDQIVPAERDLWIVPECSVVTALRVIAQLIQREPINLRTKPSIREPGGGRF